MYETDSISPSEFAAGWMLDLFKDDGPSRLEMFQILEGLGLNVPPYGTPGILQQRYGYGSEVPVVVHLNDWSLQGRDKELMPLGQALEEHPDKLCSWFVPKSPFGPEGRTVSYRLLKIGRKTFTLRFTSRDEWRSNWGPVIETRVGPDGWFPAIHRPIWAIDFIRFEADTLFTTDFNIRPGVSQPEVLEALPDRSVIGALTEWFEVFGTDVKIYKPIA
jgi:hypothetical protein